MSRWAVGSTPRSGRRQGNQLSKSKPKEASDSLTNSREPTAWSSVASGAWARGAAAVVRFSGWTSGGTRLKHRTRNVRTCSFRRSDSVGKYQLSGRQRIRTSLPDRLPWSGCGERDQEHWVPCAWCRRGDSRESALSWRPESTHPSRAGVLPSTVQGARVGPVPRSYGTAVNASQ